MIVLFLAQTSHPYNVAIFGVTINLLTSYLIFLAFILPLNRSIWYAVFALGILFIASSNSWLVVILPTVYIYLISNYIHNKKTTAAISFFYLLMALIGYEVLLILIATISGDLLNSDILNYIVRVSLVDIISIYLLSIIFILIIGKLLRPSRKKLILE